MPAFLNKVFKRDSAAAARKAEAEAAAAAKPIEVKYQDAWFRTSVTPGDVQELLRGCTNEIKHRGLSTPFLLLPFRPNSDPSAARTFIRNFFNPATGPLRGEHLQQELRLTEPVVLCSTLKWCWSRLPGGVVTWDVYELFRQGEVDSSMARDSFATFIPISAESEARSRIIFDFFDLISAIAAHGKHNGLGGMKLSRLAGWWAFEHTDGGWGFEGGYASWSRAADATAHMFFAYLRSLSPAEGVKGVSVLPISLKALLASVDYPPTAPSQLQSPSVRVVITVENVSPTPFALLRRAKNFRYDEREKALQVFMQYEDPVQALTDECKRVMKCISSTNQSSAGAFKTSTGIQEQSWSRFQDMGFSGLLEESGSDSEGDVDGLSMRGSENYRRRRASTQPATPRQSEMGIDIARPTTPSWADFMQSGFGERDQGSNGPRPLLLPPDKVLPPIETDSRARTSQSHRKIGDSLDPGELSSVSPMNVDDAFWWVWMSSLAGEEPQQRKAVFGRCALVETVISGGRWLIVEEKVKGAAVKPDDAFLAKEKKKSMRSILSRRKSMGRSDMPIEIPAKFDPSVPPPMNRTKVGPDQAAKIQSAAASLRQQQAQLENNQSRAPGHGQRSQRTNSVFTLQPVILSEATPAMKWASKYDRDAIRDAYLNGLPLPEGNAPSRPATERSLPALPTEGLEGEREEDYRPRPVSMMPPPTQPMSRPEPASKPEPISKSEPINKPEPISKPAPISKVTSVLPSQTPAPMNHPALSLPSPTTNGRTSPALQSPPLSPPSQKSRASTNSTPEKTKKTNRFKSFFSGSKKSEPGRTTPQPIETSNNGNLGAPTQGLGRKPSMSKKKHSPIEFQGTVSEAAPATQLVVPTSETRPQLHESGSSNPCSEEMRVATQAFSSFDQGPLIDQPAFIPDDDSSATSESASPAEESRPMVPEKEDSVMVSEESASVSPVEMPVQDRWAQIRKNAAERAKVAPKTSEEYTDARGSIDDGETSGEETIESRVARIKARVAELTGNVEANRV